MKTLKEFVNGSSNIVTGPLVVGHIFDRVYLPDASAEKTTSDRKVDLGYFIISD